MTDKVLLMADPRVIAAIEKLDDAIAVVMAEAGERLKSMEVVTHSTHANNVMVSGCSCQNCRNEILDAARRVAKGRKPEAVHAMGGKAVH